jgi:hypothetical protein
MQFRGKAALIAGSLMSALCARAFAQSPPQPPADPVLPDSARAPLCDPRQLPTVTGEVQQFTLTPRGDIDGLILTDGTEVETAPRLSTEIAYAIKPGDRVTIHGLRAAALPLVQAVSVTDDATQRTVLDAGLTGPGPGAPLPSAAPEASVNGPLPGLTQVEGRVRMMLHGPRADVNGALLVDGTILRLPPPEAYRFASLLQPGQTVVVAGTELVTPMGKVMDARQIGPSPTQLSLVATPPGPPGSHPPGPPRP